MHRPLLHYLTFLLFGALLWQFSSCRDTEVLEGDELYHWTGRIVKTCDGEPATDEILILRSVRAVYEVGNLNPNPLEPTDYEEKNIAVSAVDADGNFDLAYRKVGGVELELHLSRANGNTRYLLSDVPKNRNFQRDISIEDCWQTMVIINNHGNHDSIYISGSGMSGFLGLPITDTVTYPNPSNPEGTAYTRSLSGIELNGEDYEELIVIPLVSTTISRADNAPQQRSCYFADSPEATRSILALYPTDSTPEGPGTSVWEWRRYPFIDTCVIEYW